MKAAIRSGTVPAIRTGRRVMIPKQRVDPSSASPVTLGPSIWGDVKINDAIRALANRARHYHHWLGLGAARIRTRKDSRLSVATIEALRYDPLDPNASREFLSALRVNSYIELEEHLLQTARELLAAEGYQLGAVTPGAVSITSRNTTAWFSRRPFNI